MLAFTVALVIAACGAADTPDDDATPGEDAAPAEEEEITELTMGFIPSRDAERIADEVGPLAERLSEVLGVPVRAEVMTNYTALIEGMRTGQIDIGFLAPFNYVQAEERADVQLILKSERRGEVTYLAQYTVPADSDIQSIEDLAATEGLRWAFPDSGSTSGYLFPGSQLMDLGVEDLEAHFRTIETGGHDAAMIALLNGDADFATTFDDARTVIEGDYPDVMEQLRVIGHTDPIPNDTISVRAGISEEWVNKIRDAFLGFNEEEDMMQIMDEVYQWTGIVAADPEDYDIVRETFEKFKDQLQ